MHRSGGFTLIELLVVMIIVGILTVAAMPMISVNLDRARATEAVASLGAIRTQLRIEHALTDAYNTNVTTGDVIDNVPGFPAGSLDGKYFDDNDYTITEITANTFMAQADYVVGGTAPRWDDIDHLNPITIDQTGTITIDWGGGVSPWR